MKKYRDQKSIEEVEEMGYKKKPRFVHERSDPFDGLPDDIVISILCKLSSTARCPSDFISILLTYVYIYSIYILWILKLL